MPPARGALVTGHLFAGHPHAGPAGRAFVSVAHEHRGGLPGYESHQFGLGLTYHRCASVERLQVLVFIASLALLVLWLVGTATIAQGAHYQFQANSVRHKRILSVLFVGLQMVQDNRIILTPAAMKAAVIEAVLASLKQGQSMAKPLKESGVYPELAIQLIAVGEAGGQLETMLAKIADIYDDEVQAGIKRLLTILEPALILGLGALIALIIVSVLLAVLSLNALVI